MGDFRDWQASVQQGTRTPATATNVHPNPTDPARNQSDRPCSIHFSSARAITASSTQAYPLLRMCGTELPHDGGLVGQEHGQAATPMPNRRGRHAVHQCHHIVLVHGVCFHIACPGDLALLLEAFTLGKRVFSSEYALPLSRPPMNMLEALHVRGAVRQGFRER